MKCFLEMIQTFDPVWAQSAVVHGLLDCILRDRAKVDHREKTGSSVDVPLGQCHASAFFWRNTGVNQHCGFMKMRCDFKVNILHQLERDACEGRNRAMRSCYFSSVQLRSLWCVWKLRQKSFPIVSQSFFSVDSSSF